MAVAVKNSRTDENSRIKEPMVAGPICRLLKRIPSSLVTRSEVTLISTCRPISSINRPRANLKRHPALLSDVPPKPMPLSKRTDAALLQSVSCWGCDQIGACKLLFEINSGFFNVASGQSRVGNNEIAILFTKQIHEATVF